MSAALAVQKPFWSRSCALASGSPSYKLSPCSFYYVKKSCLTKLSKFYYLTQKRSTPSKFISLIASWANRETRFFQTRTLTRLNSNHCALPFHKTIHRSRRPNISLPRALFHASCCGFTSFPSCCKSLLFWSLCVQTGLNQFSGRVHHVSGSVCAR